MKSILSLVSVIITTVLLLLCLWAEPHAARAAVRRTSPPYVAVNTTDPPTCVHLQARGGQAYMYHWFVLNLGGLFRFYRRARTVTVFTPWPRADGEARFHGESRALFFPDLAIKLGAESPSEGCVPEFGAALFADDRPDPAAHYFLRGLFLRALARAFPGAAAPRFNASELVYITRAGRPQRAVLNEADFLPALAARGIRFVQLEELSLAEKLRLFATARLIISPQSAGLTFIPAADRRALVIEIFQDVDAMRHYEFAAADVDVPFARFSALKVVGPTVPICCAHFNFIVDARALVLFIDASLAATAARAAAPRVCSRATDAQDERSGITHEDRAASAAADAAAGVPPCAPAPPYAAFKPTVSSKGTAFAAAGGLLLTAAALIFSRL